MEASSYWGASTTLGSSGWWHRHAQVADARGAHDCMPARVASSQRCAGGTLVRTSAQWPMPRRIMLVAALLCAQVAGAADTGRTVVELFTSQGCSSCPPADAVAGRLRANPAVIVLSFHVNYWDGPQWTDPFASQASTDRQYAYSRA